MSKSDGYARGYFTAVYQHENEYEGFGTNPFVEGTDAHEGYEDAVYDLTQK